MGCFPINKAIVVQKQSQVKTSNCLTNNAMSLANESNNTNKLNLIEKNNKQNQILPSEDKIENKYLILQRFNSMIPNSFKLMTKIKQELFIMKKISKKTIEHLKNFKNDLQILKHYKIKHFVNIIEVFEDNVNYYIITENFEGNKLFDTSNIEIKLYNEKIIKKIIKYLHSLIKDFCTLKIKHFNFFPQNIFWSLNDNEKLKLHVFYDNETIKNDEYINEKSNFYYKLFFKVYNGQNINYWQLGLIMFLLFYGYPSFLNHKDNDMKDVPQKLEKFVSKNEKDETHKKILVTLLNNKSLSDEKIKINWKNCKKNEDSFYNSKQELEKMETIKNFFLSYSFLYKHYEIINEFYLINEKVEILSKSVSDITQSVPFSNLFTIFSNHIGSSMISMEMEKIKGEYNLEYGATINMDFLYTQMFVILFNQQLRQFKRLYSQIDTINIVIDILLFDSSEFSNKMISTLKEKKEEKITEELYLHLIIEILFALTNNKKNHLKRLFDNQKTANYNIGNDSCFIVDSKWYSNEDFCHIESLIKDHCSSSDICSSSEDENNKGK